MLFKSIHAAHEARTSLFLAWAGFLPSPCSSSVFLDMLLSAFKETGSLCVARVMLPTRL